MPAWKERLSAAPAREGELLVWDLGRVSPDDVEPGAEPGGDPKKRIRVRPLTADGLANGLVTSVTDRSATVDLGRATGVLTLAGLVTSGRRRKGVSPRGGTDVIAPPTEAPPTGAPPTEADVVTTSTATKAADDETTTTKTTTKTTEETTEKTTEKASEVKTEDEDSGDSEEAAEAEDSGEDD